MPITLALIKERYSFNNYSAYATIAKILALHQKLSII